MSQRTYSVAELADTVNQWCRKHDVLPLDNRSGADVTVRNVRYYQTLGIVDRPVSPDGRGFTEKHRLQLIAIRLLQAKGLPLNRIQSLVYNRSEEDLREIQRRGLKEIDSLKPAAFTGLEKDWKLIAISDDLLLLSRTGRDLTPAQKLKIQEILAATMQTQLN
jgi:DNA-binding transcriptional MerR regulator